MDPGQAKGKRESRRQITAKANDVLSDAIGENFILAIWETVWNLCRARRS
ncbi:hypothetical protein [Flavobacterium sp.]|jgi:hypothetical protein